MKSLLDEKLNFKLKPVAIFFSDEKPEAAFEISQGRRDCAAARLVAAAAKEQVSVFSERGCGCPGAAVGLCFGNGFKKIGFPVEALLSQGDEVLRQRGIEGKGFSLGERFFASPQLAGNWAEELPYAETGLRYVIFKPLALVEENERPDLIFLLANPDQLSVLVILAGYYRGTALNVIAPFASACQSILLAWQEARQECPKAVIGYFDISQRGYLPKELLSLTLPYPMFQEMEKGAEDGCTETPAWRKIQNRF